MTRATPVAPIGSALRADAARRGRGVQYARCCRPILATRSSAIPQEPGPACTRATAPAQSRFRPRATDRRRMGARRAGRVRRKVLAARLRRKPADIALVISDTGANIDNVSMEKAGRRRPDRVFSACRSRTAPACARDARADRASRVRRIIGRRPDGAGTAARRRKIEPGMERAAGVPDLTHIAHSEAMGKTPRRGREGRWTLAMSAVGYRPTRAIRCSLFLGCALASRPSPRRGSRTTWWCRGLGRDLGGGTVDLSSTDVVWRGHCSSRRAASPTRHVTILAVARSTVVGRDHARRQLTNSGQFIGGTSAARSACSLFTATITGSTAFSTASFVTGAGRNFLFAVGTTRPQ